jgi:uncharacterized membrane protein HdeD (DUF308 family)
MMSNISSDQNDTTFCISFTINIISSYEFQRKFTTNHLSSVIGIALLFGGAASIAQAFSGRESGWKKAFLIGVGALLIVIGVMVLVSPVFGAQFAGFVIAIGLLIAGIQMIAVSATGRKMMPDSSITK